MKLVLVLLIGACTHEGSSQPQRSTSRPPRTPDPNDPELAKRVLAKFSGPGCQLERTCGPLIGVDCDAAVDGPYYYVDAATLETIATCGGACMTGRCQHCPPAAWDCTVY